MIFNKLKTKFKILAIILFGVALWGGLVLNVQATDLGGPTSANPCGDGAVSISKSASGSGTSPNGTISLTVSTTNVCSWITWSVSFHGHAGPHTQYSPWTNSSGTGQSYTFTFLPPSGGGLSAGDYTVSGDAQFYWWNGSTWVLWGNLSTTAGSVTISNPPPPPPPPPPAPTTPSLQGPTSAYYGGNVTYTWTAVSGATYYLFGYQYQDAGGSTISSISDTIMVNIGDVTSRSLTVTTDTNAKTLYGILVACNSSGCSGWSNSVGATLSNAPGPSGCTGVCLELNPTGAVIQPGGSASFTAQANKSPSVSGTIAYFDVGALSSDLNISPSGSTQCTYAGNTCGVQFTLNPTANVSAQNHTVQIVLSSSVSQVEPPPTASPPSPACSNNPTYCLNSPNPSSFNITQGTSVTVDISATLSNPSPQVPIFQISGASVLPSGVTASIGNTRDSVDANAACAGTGGIICRATLTITASSNAATTNGSVMILMVPSDPAVDVTIPFKVVSPTTASYKTYTLNVLSPTLDVTMSHSSSPSSNELVNGQVVATFSTSVGGTATGNITYTFDCKNGSAVQKVTTTNASQQFSCTYTSLGTFNPTLLVSRSNLFANTYDSVTTYNPTTCSPGSQSKLTGQTASFSASGGNSQYSWTASGGNPSSGNGSSFSTSYSTSGTKTVTLTSTNGGSASCSVIVNSAPVSITSFTATPTAVFAGQTSSLQWSTKNATSCTASANPSTSQWTGSKNASGSVNVSPIDTTLYTLTCSGAGGANPISANVTVNVSTLTVKTSVASVKEGSTIQLQAFYDPDGALSPQPEQDVTAQATWASNDTKIATVGNSSGSKGLVTGLSKGEVFISATYNSTQAISDVTVTKQDPVSCTPSGSNPAVVVTGQGVTFSASGGDGKYNWTATGGSPNSGNQTTFTTKYNTSGAKTITVASQSQSSNSANCTVTVNSPTVSVSPVSSNISIYSGSSAGPSASKPATPTATPYSGVSNVNVNSCQDITSPGNYYIKKDITSSGTTCLNVHDTSNVYIDCGGRFINMDAGGNASDKASVLFKNIKNFTLTACSLKINNPASFSNWPYYTPLIISIGSNGLIDQNTLDRDYVDIEKGSNITISNNVFNGILNQNYNTNTSILNNAFKPVAGTTGSAVVGWNYSSNTKVINNVIDGISDGNYFNQNGLDDGIAFQDSSGDTIQDNTIKNVWDCGIESTGVISNTQIRNNYIKNSGFCGIGGWYWSSWLSNIVSGNIIDITPTMFKFSRIYGLRPANFSGSGIPADTYVYFKDNDFNNNLFVNPNNNSSGFAASFDLSTISLAGSGSKPYSSNNVVVTNNKFSRDNFPLNLSGPYFTPTSMIIDGGNNVCKTPSASSGYPIACSSSPSGQTQLQVLYDPDGAGPAAGQDVTGSTIWTSDNAGIASVNNSTQKGFVTGNAAGSTTVRGSYTDPYGNSPAGSAAITVAPDPSLSVFLIPDPYSGYGPTTVNLNASVASNQSGTTNFTFWWNCNDAGTSVAAVTGVCGDPNDPAKGVKFSDISANSKSVNHVYSMGEYVPKVIVERGSTPPAENRFSNGGGVVIHPPPNSAPTVTPQEPQGAKPPPNWSLSYCLTPFDWTLLWTFSDPGQLQSAYQLTITDTSTGQTITDTGKVNSGSSSYAIPLGVLAFNKTYSWTIKVWDNDGWNILSSSVVSGSNFSTIQHAAPVLSFTRWPAPPQTIAKDQQVTLTDTTVVSGGSSKTAWNWDFSKIPVSDYTLFSATNGSQVVVKFTTSGDKKIKLSVTDSDGLWCEKETGSGLPALNVGRGIPKFKEILPR